MLLDQCSTLDDFLLHYGKQLSVRARATLDPMHTPGRDAVLYGCHGSDLLGAGTDPIPAGKGDVVLPFLKRKPFDSQGNVMAGIVKGLAAQKSIQLVAEMGTGKTLMSEGAAHAHCLRKNQNHWNRLVSGGRGQPDAMPREQRKAMANAILAQIRATHGEIKDVGPLKMQEIIALEGTERPFTFFGRKFTVDAVAYRGGHRIGQGPVYDVVATCRSTVDRNTPVAFRCTCKGAYRVLIVCPTVLLAKWERELIETVPSAAIFRLKKYQELISMALQYRDDRGPFEKRLGKGGERLDDMGAVNATLEPGERMRRSTFKTYPIGYEFYLIGRDNMKLSGAWKHAYLSRWLINSGGRGMMVGKNRGDGLPCCPDCGSLVRRKPSGTPEDESYFDDARRVCKAKVKAPDREGTMRDCGARLWCDDRDGTPRRYAPARIIKKRLRGFFDVSIFDEAHEYNSDDSLQADAMGGIMSASRKGMALTGTLVGGYAWHLRTLLYRLKIAHSLIAEGLGWKDKTEFDKRYGRIFTRETIYPEGDGKGRARGKNKKRQPYVKAAPGIVYSVFKHLIHNSIFLTLEEVAANLPHLSERTMPVVMDPELAQANRRLEADIANHIRDKLIRGSKAALGMMVNTTLLYPDHPYGYENGVGYWEFNRVTKRREWVTVSYPASLDPTKLRNKELACLEWVKAMHKQGHQVWVYCVFNGEKDTQGPLATHLRAAGLRVAELRRETVTPAKREDWITKNGPKNDVIVSHPGLVKTGLDFFDKRPGGHNYSAIGFYQSGYSIFTLRQASRRAWRIGQKRPCETAYFYYQQSMQERCMGLMGKKIQAAQQLEGDFSTDGLASMAGDEGGVEAALARSLIEASDETGGCRAWNRVTDGGVVKDHKPVDVGAALAEIERIMAEMNISADELEV